MSNICQSACSVRDGGRAVALGANLADEDETQALLPAAEAALGPVDCLINNAAVFERCWGWQPVCQLLRPIRALLNSRGPRVTSDGATCAKINNVPLNCWFLV